MSWYLQLEVLTHKAIGSFMTHCGWNSTLEALSLGVPMVAMPQWTDQLTNAKFIVDVWKVGVRIKMNEIATKDEIELYIMLGSKTLGTKCIRTSFCTCWQTVRTYVNHIRN